MKWENPFSYHETAMSLSKIPKQDSIISQNKSFLVINKPAEKKIIDTNSL
jgi:23S rRNA-/tRNA-specific pseudouridylate synthase